MFDYYRQLVKISLAALLANKGRSFLTMLGIIIGTAAVIIIISAGAGAQNLILGQIKDLGTDLVSVNPGKSEEGQPPASVMGAVITSLRYEDLKALNKGVANIVSATGFVKGVSTLSWQGNTYDTNLTGTGANYLDTEGGDLVLGRFFTNEEEMNMARVIVLGSVVKDELLGDSEALGQKIKIKNEVFEVIGVMKSRGQVAFQDYDDQVFIPLKTMQKGILGINHLNYIRIKVSDGLFIPETIADIETVLRSEHNIDDLSGGSDDFTVGSLAEALDALSSVTDALRYFLAAMAAISLLVGGIGIMNIMLINVAERTREIGLRKAVGADNSHIVGQFLAESIFITFLGGVIGIIFGILISWLVSVVARLAGLDWLFSVSVGAIILAVLITVGIGLVFGIYPAFKASKLAPTEALRYE